MHYVGSVFRVTQNQHRSSIVIGARKRPHKTADVGPAYFPGIESYVSKNTCHFNFVLTITAYSRSMSVLFYFFLFFSALDVKKHQILQHLYG